MSKENILLSRLKRLLNKCKRCSRFGTEECKCFELPLLHHLDMVTTPLQDCECFIDKPTEYNLDDLLDEYHETSHECINGRCIPINRKKNYEVFIVNPDAIIPSEEGGHITLKTNESTLGELVERSRDTILRRRIYYPNNEGKFIYDEDYIFDSQKSLDSGSEIWISLIIMQNNGWQRYDKMYILDALDPEDNTAFNLEKQVLEYKYLGKDFCKRIKVTTLEQWESAMKEILQTSNHKSVPIIHLEMHGTEDGDLILNEKVFITVENFLKAIDQISQKCNAKVLVTLAVCRGLKFYEKFKNKFDKLPCSYVVGSKQPVHSYNVERRFSAFYKELLQDSTTQVNIKRAFAKMQDIYVNDTLLKEEYKDEKFVMITENNVYDEQNYKKK